MNKKDYKKIFLNSSIYELADRATKVKNTFHPEKIVTFVVDRNINYTNICCCKCNFCYFYNDEGYILEYKEIKPKIQELAEQNGTQVLLQGGLNPDLEFSYYENLLSSIKQDFPQITIHAFSPTEIDFFSKRFNKSSKSIIQNFISCGLSSIPGGGAEILVDSLRKKVSPKKILSKRWLSIMKEAHTLGIKTTATMVFDADTSIDDIIAHLLKIKDLQAKTGGFRAFIPWTFQGTNSKASCLDYLKIVALSRIVLSNISNIQASWVTQGIDIAQLSLSFGANDFGGTMMEENVVSSAGCTFDTNKQQIIHTIKKAGYKPAQRDTAYNILNIYD